MRTDDELREELDRGADRWQASPNASGRPKANGQGPHGQAGANQFPELITAADFVKAYVAPDWVIDGLVQRSRLFATTGATGHGKTAVALCQAIHIATGRHFGGRAVEPGQVLYCASENPDDVRARMCLCAEKMSLDLSKLPLQFIDKPFDLKTGFEQLAHHAQRLGELTKIYLDTGASFLLANGVVDENNNMQALSFARDARALTTLPGRPTVNILLHPIKHPKGPSDLLPRGGGAMLNEVDGNYTIWAEGQRKTTSLHWTGKFRGPDFDPMTFELLTETTASLVDKKGRLMPNVWARAATSQVVEQHRETERSDEDSVLLIMKAVPSKSLAGWARNLGWHRKDGVDDKQRVQRAVVRLSEDGFAAQMRGEWRLTKAGNAEAEELERRAK